MFAPVDWAGDGGVAAHFAVDRQQLVGDPDGYFPNGKRRAPEQSSIREIV